MPNTSIRIRIGGRLSDHTAAVLGGRMEQAAEGEFWLLVDFVDQSQLTGLLVRLGDLHIPYDRVELGGTHVAAPELRGLHSRPKGEAK